MNEQEARELYEELEQLWLKQSKIPKEKEEASGLEHLEGQDGYTEPFVALGFDFSGENWSKDRERFGLRHLEILRQHLLTQKIRDCHKNEQKYSNQNKEVS